MDGLVQHIYNSDKIKLFCHYLPNKTIIHVLNMLDYVVSAWHTSELQVNHTPICIDFSSPVSFNGIRNHLLPSSSQWKNTYDKDETPKWIIKMTQDYFLINPKNLAKKYHRYCHPICSSQINFTKRKIILEEFVSYLFNNIILTIVP